MDELIPLLAIFFGLGVPAMSLATHFVLRPLVKDIVAATGVPVQASGGVRSMADLDAAVAYGASRVVIVEGVLEGSPQRSMMSATRSSGRCASMTFPPAMV